MHTTQVASPSQQCTLPPELIDRESLAEAPYRETLLRNYPDELKPFAQHVLARPELRDDTCKVRISARSSQVASGRCAAPED